MMDKKLIKGALLLVLLTVGPTVDAQNLGNVLSSMSSKVNRVLETTDAADIVGNAKITNSQLAGTWSYDKPTIAFESNRLASKAGGAVVARTIENRLAAELANYGIKTGVLKLTFTADGRYSCVVGEHQISGTYKTDGPSVFFNATEPDSEVKANAKVGNKRLQLTFPADKLLLLLQQVGANADDARLKTIVALAKNYNGMQIGMKMSSSK